MRLPETRATLKHSLKMKQEEEKVEQATRVDQQGEGSVDISDRSCALYPQVLLKACAYTQERHVFGDIFFCRVDKDVDACRWLEVSEHPP